MKKRKMFCSVALPVGGTALLFCVISLLFGLFPFGENSLSYGDMKQQVIPLLLDLKQILLGQQDMLLFVGGGGGISFWGVFLFFLASPFSFLVLAIPDSELSLYINILVGCKMMTAAATAGLFFAKATPKLPNLQRCCLAVSYAFCGYTLLFYQNLVWLDMLYLFPLLVLAMNRLREREKVGCYILVLSAMICVQFYLSYMVLLFVILYFGVFLFTTTDKAKRNRVLTLLGSGTVLSLLCTAAAWIPAFLQFLDSARGVSLFASLSSGSFVTDLATCVPYLYCGGILLAALLFVLSSKQWKNPELQQPLILLPLMLLPLLVDPINKMWHTGSYQCFPVRYGYILTLLGLLIAALVLQRMESEELPEKSPRNSKIGVAVLVGIAVAAAIVIWFVGREDFSHYIYYLSGSYASWLWLTLAALPCVGGLFFGLRMLLKKKMTARLFTLLLAGITATECVFGGCVYFGSAANDDNSVATAISVAAEIPETEYRTKQLRKYFDVNLLSGVGLNTLDHYTSLTRENYLYSMKDLGYSAYWMEVGGQGGTSFTDQLLGIKYLISKAGAITPTDEVISQGEEYTISAYANTASLAFLLPTNTDLSELPEKSRIALQNLLYQTITGTDDEIFTYISPTEEQNCCVRHKWSDGSWRIYPVDEEQTATICYTVSVEGEQSLYFECYNSASNAVSEDIYGSFRLTVNGEKLSGTYPSQSNNGLYYLGTFCDETVTVEAKLLQEVNCNYFGLYAMDEEATTAALEDIENQEVSIDGNTVTVSCQSENETTLFLSLPYDSGYTATVNGVEAEVSQIFGTFCAVTVPAGESTVVLTYTPAGLQIGIILSIVGVLLAVVLLIYLHKRGLPHWISHTEPVINWAFYLIFELTIVLVYIFPVIVYLIGRLTK